MAWYKAAWINPFFAALDAIAPQRDRRSDGTIGDLAHASGISGHNPDDTPGVKAERTDADTRPEVRAADAGADLRAAPITMQLVVDAIVTGPDRGRLIYVIFRMRIYRKANDWRAETYAGSDPHDTHVHLSGDPAADDDGRPWTSILALGGDGMTPEEHNWTSDTNSTLGSLIQGFPATVKQSNGKSYPIIPNVQLQALVIAAGEMRTQLETLIRLASGETPPSSLVLSDADVQRVAEATADELHRRSAE